MAMMAMKAKGPGAPGMRILLIEDDPSLRAYVKAELVALGHEVDEAGDGKAGLLAGATGAFDILVIDRMLPNLDGLSVLKGLRAMGVETPVILLTALSRVDERVKGLRAGADDYMVKPFEMPELTARIEAVIRRQALLPGDSKLRVGELELDRLSRAVSRAGRPISLKPREFRLLEYLMLNEGTVVTRTMLLEAVWDFHFDPQTSLVESHISRIRAKVDRGFESELIHTVWGAGYRISNDRPQ